MATTLDRAALDSYSHSLLIRPHILQIPLKAILPTLCLRALNCRICGLLLPERLNTQNWWNSPSGIPLVGHAPQPPLQCVFLGSFVDPNIYQDGDIGDYIKKKSPIEKSFKSHNMSAEGLLNSSLGSLSHIHLRDLRRKRPWLLPNHSSSEGLQIGEEGTDPRSAAVLNH